MDNEAIDLARQKKTPFRVNRGQVIDYTIFVKNPDGTDYDFTGHTGEMYVYNSFSKTDTPEYTITVTLATGSITFNHAAITRKREDAVYQLWITDNLGYRQPWLNGPFLILNSEVNHFDDEEITFPVEGVPYSFSKLIGNPTDNESLNEALEETAAAAVVESNSYTDVEVAQAVFTSSYGIIYPEFYGVVGTGTAPDSANLATFFAAVSAGANALVARTRRFIYQTAIKQVITGTPIIDFPATLQRTTASTIDTIAQLSLGTGGLVEIKLNVDGNIANANTCVGTLIDSGQNNTKAKFELSAKNTTVGHRLTGNVEKVFIMYWVSNHTVGVNVFNDGTSATVDEAEIKIIGSDCDTFFLSDGTQKTTWQVNFDCEQADDPTKYGADISNGAGPLTGIMRSLAGGGVKLSTTAVLNIDFNLTLYGKQEGSALHALFCDAANCAMSGRLTLHQWNEGVEIQRCGPSSLQIIKRDSGATGTGLKLGDFASTKQVNGFYLLPGSCGFGSVALNLDYASFCILDYLTLLEGTITIGANSSYNKILLPKFERATLITNNRTEKDNIIFYKGFMTNSELEQINGGTFFGGMIVEGSTQHTSLSVPVLGNLWYCEDVAAWVSGNGKTYNTTTNTWS